MEEKNINKNVEKVEGTFKNVLFTEIREISSKQDKLIQQIGNLGKYTDLESGLPNIGITLNNKIIELQHEFERAGLSIYSKYQEWGDFVGTSFIGDAVIFDLISYASKGIQNLTDYDKKMKEVTEKKIEKVQGLEKSNPVRKFWAKIKNFFVPIKQEDLSYTQEEKDSVNHHLSDYRDTNNKLWEYNLRDNIIPSIVRQIRDKGYDAFTVPGLLEEQVIPDLEKLGLADLIPQLQQTLIEEYEKDLPKSEIYKVEEDDLYLYIPDFNRKNEAVNFEELHQQVKSVIMDNKETLEEAKRTLGKEGISLEDIYLVDKTSNVDDRQSAVSAIKEELNPEQEINKHKEQGTSDISLND